MHLSAENLACSRGGREVFRGLSFSLPGGEALLVTGRNGAGKSSLLRVIAGLVRLSGGQLALDGGDLEAAIGEQSHYLGHQDALKPSLTVTENLQFWAAFLGDGGDAVEPALESVDLGRLADPMHIFSEASIAVQIAGDLLTARIHRLRGPNG